MTSSDETMARAKAALQDARARRHMPIRPGGIVRAKRAVKFAGAGVGAVVLAAIIWGLVSPIGIGGVIIAMLAILAAVAVAVVFSREADVSREQLNKVDLKSLPGSTGRWLHAQRQLLPAPAQMFAQSIGVRLDQIAPQLAALDDREPAALEIRRLIAEELPELVAGYERVPANLRREGLNGVSPDRQLTEGLAVVDSELKRMSEQLARGDLYNLATQGRYLELKYQGEGQS